MNWIVFLTIANASGSLTLGDAHCFTDIGVAQKYMGVHKNCIVLSLARHPELRNECGECDE